ncbi:MAG: hypothetical protein JSS69_18945 [Acidobacteria bacterium]|nr:hypothetical protein [Pseudomonadota bacterium]MBS1867994.1 hypothetical protein [Acidobacteriota bacterium]
MTDEEPSYEFRYEAMTIEAAQFAISPDSFQPHFRFTVSIPERRALRPGGIQFETPLAVESDEYGVALLSWLLDKSIGKPYSAPGWVESGRAKQHLLPWVQERRNHELRPQCRVPREWLKLAMRDLSDRRGTASANDVAQIIFDGERLRLTVAGKSVDVRGFGTAWPTFFSVPYGKLRAATSRLMNPEVHIEVWKNMLRVGRRAIDLVRPDEGSQDRTWARDGNAECGE